jgi:hypothetical protein
MNRRSGALAPCLALFLFAAWANGAGAQPLSLYRDEAVARLHCSGDAVVWLDFKTRRYYAAGQARYGQARYGQGRNAVFTCRNQARRSGYRRSIFGRR